MSSRAFHSVYKFEVSASLGRNLLNLLRYCALYSVYVLAEAFLLSMIAEEQHFWNLGQKWWVNLASRFFPRF